jgi:hypothetical protein
MGIPVPVSQSRTAQSEVPVSMVLPSPLKATPKTHPRCWIELQGHHLQAAERTLQAIGNTTKVRGGARNGKKR